MFISRRELDDIRVEIEIMSNHIEMLKIKVISQDGRLYSMNKKLKKIKAKNSRTCTG